MNASATSVAPSTPAAHPAEVDRELRGERARRELREREALDVVLLRDPAPSLDEVALHVPGERDRPAEAERPQAQEVHQERPEGRRNDLFFFGGLWRRGGCGHPVSPLAGP